MSSPLSTLTRSLVYQSNSVNPFYNLALEEWLSRNVDLTRGSVLFIYRNSPCIVIGRYQNPWSELNLKLLKNHNLLLVRRNSGGGAVFHDLENCNLSFISRKEEYNRNNNLNIVTHVLKNFFSIASTINDKMDIICKGCKVSGSASKLTRSISYHHCTLLLRSDISLLRGVLKSLLRNQITTAATKSTISTVANLSDFNSKLNFNTFTQALIVYYNTLNNNLSPTVCRIPDNLPCIINLASEYSSWQWLYGKTPPFKLQLNEGLGIEIKTGLVTSIVGRDHEEYLNTLINAEFRRQILEEKINKFPNNSKVKYTITALLPFLN